MTCKSTYTYDFRTGEKLECAHTEEGHKRHFATMYGAVWFWYDGEADPVE